MKLTILTILISGFVLNLSAQKPIRNTVKAGAFIGSANASYERLLLHRLSFAVTPALGIFNSNGIRYSIAGGGAELRFFLPVLKQHGLNGLYLSTGAGIYSGNASVKLTNGVRGKTPIDGTAIKATIGYQHIFKSRLVLDFSGGTQYLKLKFKGGGGLFINDEAFSGYVPYVGVGVGYAF